MTDNESDETQTTQRSWLDRLSDALLREPQDREQLISLLRDSEQRHLLDADALAMIEGILQFSEMHVRDVMIPRAQTIVINENEQLTEFLPTVIESTHSRFPVTGSIKDEVIGILHAKDLLQYSLSDKPFSMRDILRPARFIPESKRLDVLLKEFRIERNHMAVVVDEYGSVSGIVTIEDILEQIVGNIEDEFDVDEEIFIKKLSDSEFIVKGLTPIAEFNAYFSTHLSDLEFDTIGGLIAQKFGHMPQRGESISLNNFTFTVITADKRRLHLLQMTVGESSP